MATHSGSVSEAWRGLTTRHNSAISRDSSSSAERTFITGSCEKQWPKVRFGEKRAITLAEHRAIVAKEANPERRAFYELCWHLGGAQSDVANLTAEDIDWQAKAIGFHRHKTGRSQSSALAASLRKRCFLCRAAGRFFPTTGKYARPTAPPSSPAPAAA